MTIVRTKHCIHTMFICCLACFFNFTSSGQPKIVYALFDSLEVYFQNEIDNLKTKEIGLLIDAFPRHSGAEIVREYNMAIINCSDRNDYKGICKRSNRVVQIGANQYPVYFLWIDDIFTRSEASKNTPTDFIYPEIGDVNFTLVDMAAKVFYVDGKPRGRVKKKR